MRIALAQHRAFELVARLRKQRERLLEHLAVAARTVAARGFDSVPSSTSSRTAPGNACKPGPLARIRRTAERRTIPNPRNNCAVRFCRPKKKFLLTHSKSNSEAIASRTRMSAKIGTAGVEDKRVHALRHAIAEYVSLT